MITYELDNETKDLFVRNGNIALVEGVDETAQDIKTRFKTAEGEVFYDVTFGVPYFRVIFQKPFDKNLVDTIMLQTIYSSPKVTNVSSFQSNIDSFSRRYVVNFTATTRQLETVEINEDFKF
jgi:hypothetical protein